MVYSLGQNLVCENLTVENKFIAHKVDDSLDISGNITASHNMTCHTLQFDRSEYTQTGTAAPDHYHKVMHVGSTVIRLYDMKMRIQSIETASGSLDAIITLTHNHGIPTTTTADCKFLGTFSRDVNGITSVAGFQINTSHKHVITPHATDPKKMTVTLAEAATSSSTDNGDFTTLTLWFARWHYLDMAKQDGWQFAYGFVAPTASYI